MSYEFKGYSWGELAECWGITVEEQSFEVGITDSDEKMTIGHLPEKIEVAYYINATRIVFTVEDEEEVLAEKIKQHMRANLTRGTGDFVDKQMRVDLVDFLNKLAEECHGYYAPLYKGISQIENDHSLTHAVIANLELLWT